MGWDGVGWDGVGREGSGREHSVAEGRRGQGKGRAGHGRGGEGSSAISMGSGSGMMWRQWPVDTFSPGWTREIPFLQFSFETVESSRRRQQKTAVTLSSDP